MPETLIGFLGVILLLILLFLGLPLAFSLLVVGVGGLIYFRGIGPIIATLGFLPYDHIAKYTLVVLPLFMLMGFWAERGGIVEETFEIGRKWLGWIRGGLPIAVNFAAAAFAACSGSSTGSVATLNRVCRPHLVRAGYDPAWSACLTACCGTFASMIPPSGLIVIYGILTEQSIGKVLLAGVFPGLLTAAFYTVMILLRARIGKPILSAAAIAELKRPKLTLGVFKDICLLWKVALLSSIIIGGIYLGVVTPTEAASLACIAALFIALISRKLNVQAFLGGLVEAAKLSAMIFFIIFAVVFFAQFMVQTGVINLAGKGITTLGAISPTLVIIAIIVFYTIMGMFFEGIGILVLTLPVFMPLLPSLGWDPIWFGIFLVKMTEIGFVTPPVGLNIFVAKATAPEIPIERIFSHILPFIFADYIVLILLIMFPKIALFLPSKIMG